MKVGALAVLVAVTGCGRIGFDPIDPPIPPGSGAQALLAAGGSTTCAVRADGSTWCWGDNRFGETGIAASGLQPLPVQATTVPADAQAIAVGAMSACAIASDGGLWCWGDNAQAELGLGSTTAIPLPQRVTLPRPAVDVAIGGAHACAVLDDASAWCWGDNSRGETGIDPATAIVMSPTHVLDSVARVTTGVGFTCVLRTDRSVWCWGANDQGELGDDGGPARSTPAPVSGSFSASAIVASGAHVCALVDGGAYACWGDDSAGELGAATGSTSELTPLAPSAMTGFTAIAGGVDFTCAMRDDHTVWCWGSGFVGQLGNHDANEISGPAQAIVTGSIVAIAAGDGHTCVRRDDDSIACWGHDSSGQLGDGRSAALVPQDVMLPGAASAVGVGSAHTCAIVGGAVYCWGNDNYDQTGFNVSSLDGYVAPTPTLVPELAGATQLALGDLHTCALIGTTVACVGVDSDGQLGDGMPKCCTATPVTVAGLPSPVTEITAGGQFTCAIAAGSAFCWGEDFYGEAGDGTQGGPSVLVPITVPIGGVGQIAAGKGHACAIDTSQHLWCWGDNSAPMQLGAEQYTLLASGGDHNCAIPTTGGLECWGSNDAGELGDGTQVARGTPAPASLGATPTAISVRSHDSCAVLAGGSISCWGQNDLGELGNGSVTAATTPTAVAITNAASVAVGDGFACALRIDGTVACWGDNAWGELANGTTTSAPVAVDVAFP